MDEMVFQCSNQNSIYVLNSNYSVQVASPSSGASHEEFRRLGLIDANAGCRATSLIGSAVGGLRDGDVCSSVSRSLQHKLKSFGNFNGAMLFGNGHNNNGTTTSAPHFNNNNNNSSSSGKSILYPSNGLKNGGAAGSIGSHNNAIVKSNLIAKKTKFWQYLEEEKLRNEVPPQRSHCSGGKDPVCKGCCATTDDAVVCVDGNCWENSGVNNKSSGVALQLNQQSHQQQQQQQQQQSTYNNKKYLETPTSDVPTMTKEHPQQCTSSNWSRSHDSTNLKPPQQQAQLTQKNSAEMYKEAAELLGLSCTLCDNCRCLDCQSGYFDCDDSDSYSEFSLMDEYDVDELDMADIAAGGGDVPGRHSYDGPAPPTTTHKLLAMHADNMTALCCDILHSQHDEASPVTSPPGIAYGLESISRDAADHDDDAEDESQRSSDTATVRMQHDVDDEDEVLVASSGTDEMNTPSQESSLRIDQVALHSTMPLANGNLTLDVPLSRCNDMENCSNFDGLSLSDAARGRECQRNEN